VGPYLLLLPATAVIAALILWPAVQVGLFSFQNYGLMQISGVLPAQWIGFANYSQILHDPEFWSSLRIRAARPGLRDRSGPTTRSRSSPAGCGSD